VEEIAALLNTDEVHNKEQDDADVVDLANLDVRFRLPSEMVLRCASDERGLEEGAASLSNRIREFKTKAFDFTGLLASTLDCRLDSIRVRVSRSKLSPIPQFLSSIISWPSTVV
jgi:hypothetical protein